MTGGAGRQPELAARRGHRARKRDWAVPPVNLERARAGG